jgi:hypothetical protein
MMQRHFASDTNELLQKVQQETDLRVVRDLYERARETYVAIPEVGAEDDALRRIEESAEVDLRVLDEAHDRMAAWFRFIHPDSAQTALFRPKDAETGRALSHAGMLRRAWLEHVRAECEDLMRNETVVRAVLEAVAFEGERRGRNAEEALLWFLDKRYRRLTRARARWGAGRW